MSWINKLLSLGDVRRQVRSDSGKRAYRTDFQRYMWGIAFLFTYLLLITYLLRGDSGSSNNMGIILVLLGALIFVGFGVIFAPRLTERLNMLTSAGKRKKDSKYSPSSKKPPSRSARNQPK